MSLQIDENRYSPLTTSITYGASPSPKCQTWARIGRFKSPAQAHRPQFRAQDAECCICIVKNSSDGHRAIGEAIILTRSLKQFQLDKLRFVAALKNWFAL
jgi:hypothetical protein